MNEPEIIVERIESIPRRLVPMTFRQNCHFHFRAGDPGVLITRGETIGVPEDQVPSLKARGIIVRPGDKLDPDPPDQTPVRVRLCRACRVPAGGPWFGPADGVVMLPRCETSLLIAAGDAALDDGTESIATVSRETTRRRARIQTRGRQLADQILERYRG